MRKILREKLGEIHSCTFKTMHSKALCINGVELEYHESGTKETDTPKVKTLNMNEFIS